MPEPTDGDADTATATADEPEPGGFAEPAPQPGGFVEPEPGELDNALPNLPSFSPQLGSTPPDDIHDHLNDICFGPEFGDVFSAFNDATEYVQLGSYDAADHAAAALVPVHNDPVVQDTNRDPLPVEQQPQPSSAHMSDEPKPSLPPPATASEKLVASSSPSPSPSPPSPSRAASKSGTSRRRSSPNNAPPKRVRPRPPGGAQPILPRATGAANAGAKRKPRSDAAPPSPRHPSHRSNAAPAGFDTTGARFAPPPDSLPFANAAAHPHGQVLPVVNMPSMYPLQQHHHPVFPSPSAAAAAAIRTGDRAGNNDNAGPSTSAGGPLGVPGGSEHKKMRVDSAGAAMQHAAQGFLSPGIPFVPGGMVPFDPNVVPFLVSPQFSQMYMAAAAAYQQAPVMQGVGQPLGVAPTVAHGFGGAGSRPPTPAHNGAAGVWAGGDSGATTPAGMTRTPAVSESLQSAGGSRAVAVLDEGPQLVVPQQAHARLERHPVLGRLQLQSIAKGSNSEAAKGGGMHMTDTQGMPDGSPKKGAAELASRAGPSVPVANEPDSQVASSSQGNGEQSRAQKKRLVWTPELHERFVKAIDAVGLNQAVPKTLVTIMNVEGLTTEHVKSHLQKYRNSLRKEAVEEARERSRQAGEGPAAVGAMARGVDRLVATAGVGASQGGLMATTKEQGMRQFQVLPGRISVFGTPVPSTAATAGGPSANRAAGTAGAGIVTGTDVSPLTSSRSEGAAGVPVSDATNVRHETNTRGTQSEVGAAAAGMGAISTINAAMDTETRAVTGGGVVGLGVGMGGNAQSVMHVRAMQARSQIGVGQASGAGAGAMGSERMGDPDESQMMAVVEMVGDGQKADGEKAAAQSNNRVGGDVGSGCRMLDGASGPTDEGKGLQLELMNERTLQMQLQLQMMVHRMIALEKKIQQEQSNEQSNDAPEAGGGTAASGRSASDVPAAEEKKEEKERERNEAEERMRQKQSEISRKSQELQELLKEQLEMSKQMEEHRAVISEMRDQGLEVREVGDGNGDGAERQMGALKDEEMKMVEATTGEEEQGQNASRIEDKG